MSSFFVETALAAGQTITLPEAAAHHARVRRIEVGDAVRLTDGAGTLAEGQVGRIARSAVHVEVTTVKQVAPPAPLELFAPVGDRERMLWLAEKAAELGVTAWKPVVFRRSRSVSPRGEGAAFAAKVRARMIGAIEQSGGAWLPDVRGEIDVGAAAETRVPAKRFLLDTAGTRLDGVAAAEGAAVILGPEGGLEPEEREMLVAGGWRPVALAPTILRFETAGIAALAVLRAGHLPPGGVVHD